MAKSRPSKILPHVRPIILDIFTGRSGPSSIQSTPHQSLLSAIDNTRGHLGIVEPTHNTIDMANNDSRKTWHDLPLEIRASIFDFIFMNETVRPRQLAPYPSTDAASLFSPLLVSKSFTTKAEVIKAMLISARIKVNVVTDIRRIARALKGREQKAILKTLELNRDFAVYNRNVIALHRREVSCIFGGLKLGQLLGNFKIRVALSDGQGLYAHQDHKMYISLANSTSNLHSLLSATADPTPNDIDAPIPFNLSAEYTHANLSPTELETILLSTMTTDASTMTWGYTPLGALIKYCQRHEITFTGTFSLSFVQRSDNTTPKILRSIPAHFSTRDWNLRFELSGQEIVFPQTLTRLVLGKGLLDVKSLLVWRMPERYWVMVREVVPVGGEGGVMDVSTWRAWYRW